MASVEIGGGNFNIGLAYLDEQRRRQNAALDSWKAAQAADQARQENNMRAQQMMQQARAQRMRFIGDQQQQAAEQQFRYDQLGQQASQFSQRQGHESQQFRDQQRAQNEAQMYMRARNDRLDNMGEAQDQEKNLQFWNQYERQVNRDARDEERWNEDRKSRETIAKGVADDKAEAAAVKAQSGMIDDINSEYAPKLRSIEAALSRMPRGSAEAAQLEDAATQLLNERDARVSAARNMSARSSRIVGAEAGEPAGEEMVINGKTVRYAPETPAEMQMNARGARISEPNDLVSKAVGSANEAFRNRQREAESEVASRQLKEQISQSTPYDAYESKVKEQAKRFGWDKAKTETELSRHPFTQEMGKHESNLNNADVESGERLAYLEEELSLLDGKFGPRELNAKIKEIAPGGSRMIDQAGVKTAAEKALKAEAAAYRKSLEQQGVRITDVTERLRKRLIKEQEAYRKANRAARTADNEASIERDSGR